MVRNKKICVDCGKPGIIIGHKLCSPCYRKGMADYENEKQSGKTTAHTFAAWLRGYERNEYEVKIKQNMVTMPLKQLQRKLASVLHPYIRLKAADKFGICTCITCKAKGKWTGDIMETGHCFTSGSHPNTRNSEHNLYEQCKTCNQEKSGNDLAFKNAIIELKGEAFYDKLDQDSKISKKWDRGELITLYTKYKYKLEKIKIEKL